MDWWDHRRCIWMRLAGAGCPRGGERLRTCGWPGHRCCWRPGESEGNGYPTKKDVPRRQPLQNRVGLSDCQLSHSSYYYMYIQTRDVCDTNMVRGGEMGIRESVAAAAGALGLCKVLGWLPLIASRNAPTLPSSAKQSYTHYYTLRDQSWGLRNTGTEAVRHFTRFYY